MKRVIILLLIKLMFISKITSEYSYFVIDTKNKLEKKILILENQICNYLKDIDLSSTTLYFLTNSGNFDLNSKFNVALDYYVHQNLEDNKYFTYFNNQEDYKNNFVECLEKLKIQSKKIEMVSEENTKNIFGDIKFDSNIILIYCQSKIQIESLVINEDILSIVEE